MLTVNLWSNVGVCNGVTGTLINIIYENCPVWGLQWSFFEWHSTIMCPAVCPRHSRQIVSMRGSNNSQETRTHTTKSLDRYFQIREYYWSILCYNQWSENTGILCYWTYDFWKIDKFEIICKLTTPIQTIRREQTRLYSTSYLQCI